MNSKIVEFYVLSVGRGAMFTHPPAAVAGVSYVKQNSV